MAKRARNLVTAFGLPSDRTAEVDTIEYRLFLAFAVFAMLFGFVLNTPSEIWVGTRQILETPGVLMSDYMTLANPGATFVNAGFLMLCYVLYLRWHHTHFTGPLIAGLFTVFGFALFGKNILNSIPITLGVFLWARLERKPPANYLVVSLFATALAPAVSYIAFAKELPFWAGIIIGYLVGIAIGIITPPLASSFIRFHHGLSLYNVGFTTGIIGMGIVALLNFFGLEVRGLAHAYVGTDIYIAIFLITTCLWFGALGIYYNHGSMRGYRGLLRHSGRLASDFLAMEGLGLTLINMSIMGIGSIVLVKSLGGTLNGPVLGSIFTVIGFSAFGKHPRNTIPVVAGAFIAALAIGNSLGSTSVLLAALFGTALGPVAGIYGPIGGLIAGFVHMAIVNNVGILHGGLNLYNNGFSAGFVAAMLIPVFDAVYRMRGKPPPLVEI